MTKKKDEEAMLAGLDEETLSKVVDSVMRHLQPPTPPIPQLPPTEAVRDLWAAICRGEVPLPFPESKVAERPPWRPMPSSHDEFHTAVAPIRAEIMKTYAQCLLRDITEKK